jgi:osmotically inducible protein OsmC
MESRVSPPVSLLCFRGQRYGFGTRFENAPGTNPEELIAAAHASCFTMALSFALAKEGIDGGTLERSRG